ncbi:MAG: DUF1570 domain-containing protein [Pirellulaceae bacterium]
MSVIAWIFLISMVGRASAPAQEPVVKQIEFSTDGGNLSTLGEVLIEYADGSNLLLTPDGQLHTLRAEDIQSEEPSDVPMTPLTPDEMGQAVVAELPEGFKVLQTKHYVLVYNSSEIYVNWVGRLFERQYSVFYNYWKSRGIRLNEPRFPLVAIVFSDKASYMPYAKREVGEAAESMIGYYNMKTNRMATYDLTGVDGLVPNGSRISSQAVIDELISRPEYERTVATIAHEAVHQLSFNGGLQTRLAENPRWLSEGMAMFFEAPDSGSASGKQRVGNVNYHNLRLFVSQFKDRPADSLSTLISDDSRMINAATASRAYPESWALTYFLFKTKSKQCTKYLLELRDLPPLGEVSPRERVERFKKHFGEDLTQLDTEFINYMRRVR